jgi:hypothetical protein
MAFTVGMFRRYFRGAKGDNAARKHAH